MVSSIRLNEAVKSTTRYNENLPQIRVMATGFNGFSGFNGYRVKRGRKKQAMSMAEAEEGIGPWGE
jgi:hypothetical protein